MDPPIANPSCQLNVIWSHTGLDSHADTCVVGCNSHILYRFPRHVDISGYDPNNIGMTNVNIVSATIAYNHLITNQTYILIIHQALYIPGIGDNLLCPFQLRMNDVKVNECPRLFTDNPTMDTHSIVIGVGNTKISLPLMLKGVTSVLRTRKPTLNEIKLCQHVILTAKSPQWNPHCLAFSEQEKRLSQLLTRS